MKEIQDINGLYTEVREIITSARQNAVRSVDFCRVQMYWQIGRRILDEEQKGKERADYGAYLLKNLAKKLEPEFGSGFSVRQLERSRQFYKMYPIASALRSQFNWTQYRLLIAISDDYKREYYELEAMNNCWTARELERQINSQLYERLLLSNDKESVLAVARKERIPQTPQEIIKDPMVLEFLGLERKAEYYEKDLQTLVESNLETILDLKFIATEFSIESYRFDSVAYNEESKSFVIIEYKRGKNESLVDQGYAYLYTLLNRKADFVLLYNEVTGESKGIKDFDWTQTRIVFISPQFTDYQKNATAFINMPFELYEVKQYESGIIAVTPINENKTITSVSIPQK